MAASRKGKIAMAKQVLRTLAILEGKLAKHRETPLVTYDGEFGYIESFSADEDPIVRIEGLEDERIEVSEVGVKGESYKAVSPETAARYADEAFRSWLNKNEPVISR